MDKAPASKGPDGGAAPANQAPLAVLLAGDSMIATDFGRALQRAMAEDAALKVRRRGKSATGLARPDYFDWMKEARRLVAKRQPEVVVIMIGGNDGQDLIGGGPRTRWGTDGWRAAYAERVRAFIDVWGARGARVVWLALPRMARPRLERKLAVIRAVQVEAVHAHPQSTYFETSSFFVDGGKPRTTVSLRGRTWPFRQEDGIHFSLPGARWFAQQLAPPLINRVKAPLPAS